MFNYILSIFPIFSIFLTGPDKGRILVVEKGGKSILAGLENSDPFREQQCRFGDKNCIVDIKYDCQATGICYEIECLKCKSVIEQEDTHTDTIANSDSQSPQAPQARSRARWAAGSRRCRPPPRYIGHSGRSMHCRMREHLEGLKGRNPGNPLWKHHLDKHKDDEEPEFKMNMMSTHRGNLPRLIAEGILIEKESQNGEVFNSRSEFGRTKVVRFTPEVLRV